MKGNAVKEENVNIEVYKTKMRSIKFMRQYLEDPDVFNSNSNTFTSFLIHSFAHLNSNFHYLSFLSTEDVHKELVKVSEIFQLLPSGYISKRAKLFDNTSEIEIHKYWIRFFSLFNTYKNECNFGSIFHLSWENKISFLKSMNNSLHYLKYNFPVVNSKKLKITDLDKEIESWKEKTAVCDVINESTVNNIDSTEITQVDEQSLITDLKLIVAMNCNLKNIDKKIKPLYCNILNNFICLIKDILKYNNDLQIIDFSFSNCIYKNIVSASDFDCSAKLYFIKHCNNLIKILKSNINV